MDNGGSRPVKKDDVPESSKRKPNKVLGKALKTIFTGKPPSSGGHGDTGNGSRVAPE
ncbi:hypothetical protein SOVF_165940 [Spinacia oleracea]|nr:hypothetical protein SOVF_165940 [Spinacia oleracea]